MTPRERALAAFRRERPDRVPKHIRPSPALAEKLREAIGTDDIDAHFGGNDPLNYVILPKSFGEKQLGGRLEFPVICYGPMG